MARLRNTDNPLSEAWGAWCQQLNSFDKASDAERSRALDQYLSFFNKTRAKENQKAAIDALMRGVPLLLAALNWQDVRAGGSASKATDTDESRGEQWRLVMAYGGFETLCSSLLDAKENRLGKGDFDALITRLNLPAYAPLKAPVHGDKVRERWFEDTEDSQFVALVSFLKLRGGAATVVRDWLGHGKPVTTWAGAADLARALRHATAHGALSASKVKEWKLRPSLRRLVEDLAQITAASLAPFKERAQATLKRPRQAEQTPPPGLSGSAQGKSLLQAIYANLDDDAPRLVYADWLEDNGDPHRAEFIRVQCELARLEVEGLPIDQPWRRQCELLAQHEKRWLKDQPRLRGLKWEWRRGFVTGVVGDLKAIQTHSNQVFAIPTLQRWSCRTILDAQRLATESWLSRFCELDLCLEKAADLELFLTSPHLGQLSDLGLRCMAGVLQARVLADCPRLVGVRRLNLCGNNLGDGDAESLARSRFISSLAALDLAINHIGDGGAKALADSPYLGSLTTLNLWKNTIRAAGAMALVRSSRLTALRSLTLTGNPIGKAGVTALAKTAFLRGESINFSGCKIGAAGLKALLASSGLKDVTSLNLTDNDLEDPAIQRLVEWPGFKRLKSLVLRENAAITRQGARLLRAKGLSDGVIELDHEPEGFAVLECDVSIPSWAGVDACASAKEVEEALLSISVTLCDECGDVVFRDELDRIYRASLDVEWNDLGSHSEVRITELTGEQAARYRLR